MINKISLIILILLFNATVFAIKNEWLNQVEKIKPLQSNEKDVEVILGKAKDRYSDVGEYETKEGLFTVTYSQGICESTITPRYKVEKGIVVQYDFRPQDKIIFSSLNIDISKLPKETTGDVSPKTISYINLEKGVNYTIHGDWLNWIEIYPAKNLSSFECSENK